MKKACMIVLLVVVVSACGERSEANRESFARAMTHYLDQRGDLCLAKYDWPIDVSAQDFKVGSRDAVQMPVLEKLGLVSSADATAAKPQEDAPPLAVAVRRYQLTETGKKYYLSRRVSEQKQVSDFCAAHLKLDQVVSWELNEHGNGPNEATVTYTYRVDAAPWTNDADARRVFPAVTRVIEGAGKAQLREGFTLTRDGWRAKDSVD
jgi:hypothetical protein